MTRAVTRSQSRSRRGPHGAFALLAADEQITRSLSGPAIDIDDPELPDALASELPTPTTYAEAISGSHGRLWDQAMRKEFSGLSGSNTFVAGS